MKGDNTQESEDNENDAIHPTTVRPSIEVMTVLFANEYQLT